ncbi:hypothetical protein [Streptomyces sp. NPDC048516]|uniref:hypothetical protein n=1 Tax=Streptomyces sp. NPDC048516 TaxID=3365565 RepID=UPI00371C40EF
MVVVRASGCLELLHCLGGGVHRGGDEQDLFAAAAGVVVFEGVLFVGDGLAADAQVGDGDVGVFGVVVSALVPVVGAGAALGADGALVVAVGQGLGAVARGPFAGAESAELRVRDAPSVAQFEFAA